MLEPPRRWGLAAAVVLAAFAPLAIGTVHLWAVSIASCFALGLMGLVGYRRVALEGKALRIGWAGAALLVLTVATATQLLPLPPSVLEALSPKTDHILKFTLGSFGLYGDDAWRPLSLDPPATAAELVRLIGLAAAFLAALNGLTERGDLKRLLAALVLVGVAVVVIGAVHKLTGAAALLGLYRSPATMSQFFNSTFVNPNHLAAFLVLATLAATGLSISEDVPSRWRRAVGAAGVVCALGVLLSLSRGGILSLIGGELLLVLLLARGRVHTRRRGWLRILLPGLLVTGIALVVALAFFSDRLLDEFTGEALLHELRGVSLKLNLWKDSLSLLPDFWLAGIGKGAFPAVYPLYQSHLGQYTFTHVENHYLQMLIDNGVLVGGAVIGALGGVLIRQIWSRRTSVSAGAIAGIVAVAVHNLADFNLEVGGVAFPFFLVLGTLVGRPNGFPRQPRGIRWRPSTWLGAAWLLGATAGVALAIPYAGTQGATRAAARIRAAGSTVQTARAVLEGEISNHPADYLVFLTGAGRLSTRPTIDIRTAMRLVNRALYLNDASATAHLVAARVLRLLGRLDQAEIEYRLAAVRDGQALQAAFKALHRLPKGIERLLRIARTFDQRIALAEFLERYRRRGEAMRLLRQLRRERPTHPRAILLSLRIELASGRADRVLPLAMRLAKADPEHAFEAAMAAGQAAEALGADRLAIGFYGLAREVRNVDPNSYLRSAILYLRRGNGPAARQVLSDLLRVNLLAASSSRFSMLLGNAWEIEGRFAEALQEYRRVRQGDPNYAQAAARIRALRARLPR